MPSATTLRLQIEAALANRIPSALTPAQKVIRPVMQTGVPAVDETLEGGLPVGAITEMIGPECSGRTSLALSCVARVTQSANVCAWIDVSDVFDPESAAAAGIDLSRLLWVRCGATADKKQQTANENFTLPRKYLAPPPTRKGLHGRGFGPHPRSEVMQRWSKPTAPRKPWSRIEQALQATDLILHGGGFSAIVLDMGNIAPEYASRVQLATWFRYRAAAEKTQTSFLLLSQHSCAKSSAELVLRFHPGDPLNSYATVFTGMEHRLEIERQRFTQTPSNVVPLRKPLQRATVTGWSTRSTWAGVR